MSLERLAIIKDYLSFRNSKVHYVSFGEGEELLICFHGFGDRANMFTALRPSLSSRFKVYAIDLPFHGQTEWTQDRFHKQDIITLIQLILKKESKQKFSLMGFSYGGRVVQSLLKDFEGQLNNIFLLAPDGIKTKWMFNTYLVPQWFRYVIRRALKNPEWLIKTLGGLRKVGLISKFVHDFGVNHIITKDRRDRIFCFWLSLNDFKLQKKKVKQQLKEMKIPIYLFFGKRDEVIPVSAGKWLADGLPNAQLFLLEEGHLLVDRELDGLLNRLLSQQK